MWIEWFGRGIRKPIRMELAEPPKPRRATDQERKELAEHGRLKVAPPEEEDVFDQDGAFGIERILDHAVDDDGIVQFKVRYVGFGPDDDLWYDEDELAALSPDLVADYKERPSWELWGRSQRQRKNRPRKTPSSVEFDGIYFSVVFQRTVFLDEVNRAEQ